MPTTATLAQKINNVLDVKTALLTFLGLLGLLLVVSAVMVFTAGDEAESTSHGDTSHNFVVTDKVVGTVDITLPEGHSTKPDIEENHTQASEPKTVVYVEKEEGLTEDSPYGLLPIIRTSDGMTAFKAYQPAIDPALLPASGQVHKVALVLKSYGLSENISTDSNQSLPAGVTYILSSYADNPQKQINAARALGHEVWLDVPVQGKRFGFDDPGPLALLAGLTPENNRKRLEMNLGKATGYVGISFETVEAFAAAPTTLGTIAQDIQARGLAITLMAPENKGLLAADMKGQLPLLTNGLSLDDDPSKIADFLEKLKVQATAQPCTIASFSASPKTLAAVTTWIKTEKNIQLTPLSHMSDCPAPHE